jgi:hypothetical protein
MIISHKQGEISTGVQYKFTRKMNNEIKLRTKIGTIPRSAIHKIRRRIRL